jgi:hypothetical protein
MKLRLIVVLGIVLLACQVGAEESLVLKTQKDRENYSTGVSFVKSLKHQGGEINLDIVIQGMKDELIGEGHLATEDNIPETMVASQSEPKKKQTCRVIVYPDHYETQCKKDDPQTTPSSPALAQEQKRDDERASAALFAATPAPPRATEQLIAPFTPPQAPASSQALVQAQQPVQFQTFDEMLVAQAANADMPAKIERSDLARRYSESWLRTQQRQ